MFKLVVLFAFLGIVAAKPGNLGYLAAPAVHAIAAPVAHATIAQVPTGYSRTFRSDIISKPVVTYAAPAPVAYAAPAPVVHAAIPAPVAHATIAQVPTGYSRTFRSDIISKPVVTYSAPAPVAYAAPIAHAAIAAPIAHAAIAAPVAHAAYAAPVALAAPGLELGHLRLGEHLGLGLGKVGHLGCLDCGLDLGRHLNYRL